MESSSLLAEWYFENSQPVTAACCHLAVNDVQVGANRTATYRGSLDVSYFQCVMRIDIINSIIKDIVIFFNQKRSALLGWGIQVPDTRPTG